MQNALRGRGVVCKWDGVRTKPGRTASIMGSLHVAGSLLGPNGYPPDMDKTSGGIAGTEINNKSKKTCADGRLNHRKNCDTDNYLSCIGLRVIEPQ